MGNLDLVIYLFIYLLIYWFDLTDEADTPSDSPVNEFVSDAFQSQTLSTDLKEVQEGIKRLGGSGSSKKANGI